MEGGEQCVSLVMCRCDRCEGGRVKVVILGERVECEGPEDVCLVLASVLMMEWDEEGGGVGRKQFGNRLSIEKEIGCKISLQESCRKAIH